MWIELLVVSVSLSIAAIQEEGQAERLFRKVVDTLSEAKSVRFKVKGEVVIEKDRKLFEGRCIVSRPNKLRVEVEAPMPESNAVKVVSDGRALVIVGYRKSQVPLKPPATLSNDILSRFAHMGFWNVIDRFNLDEEEEEEQNEELAESQERTVTRLRLDKPEKVDGRECQLLRYSLKFHREREVFDVALWIDRKSLLPVKRSVRAMRGDEVLGTFSEVYSEMTINSEIDPAEFTLPRR